MVYHGRKWAHCVHNQDQRAMNARWWSAEFRTTIRAFLLFSTKDLWQLTPNSIYFSVKKMLERRVPSSIERLAISSLLP